MAEPGRPTKYSDELAEKICLLIAEGESLRAICQLEEMPSKSTVLLWVVQDREDFSDRYAKACEVRAYHWAEELVEISDDGRNDWMEKVDKEGECIGWQVNGEALNRSRLRVDTRKWLLSKLLKKFSEKQELEHTGSLTIEIVKDFD